MARVELYIKLEGRKIRLLAHALGARVSDTTKLKPSAEGVSKQLYLAPFEFHMKLEGREVRLDLPQASSLM